MTRAHRRAIALAVSAGYPTKSTITPIIARALREAAAVSSLAKN